MVSRFGSADVIAEYDPLRRLLLDYGVDTRDESVRSQFVEKHLASLEAAQNEVAARSGFVLKRAYEGFGLGYKVPLALLAIGRTMIGVDLAVTAPFIASNPVAFSCAAVGAIYYGYSALSDDEKAAICQVIAEAFGFGVELVASIARFCIELLGSVFDRDLLKELKESLAYVANALGTSLYAVTGALKDRLASVALATIENATWLVNSTAGVATATANGVVDSGRNLLGWEKAPDKLPVKDSDPTD